MSEHDPGASDAVHELADAIANKAIIRIRYGDFMARKAARVFMEDIGLVLQDDEEGNTALEEVLGVSVAAGMSLNLVGTTTQEDVQEQATRLSNLLPAPLREPIGPLIPRTIEYGIDFHRDEMQAGSPKVTEWTEEYLQLQAIDPHHELWGE